MGKNQKAPKKKPAPFRTTSKKTGAIILTVTIISCVLILGFFLYASDFAEKQKQYENNWRLLNCEDMLKDNSIDPFVWKVLALKDKNCITTDQFEKMLNQFTR